MQNKLPVFKLFILTFFFCVTAGPFVVVENYGNWKTLSFGSKAAYVTGLWDGYIAFFGKELEEKYNAGNKIAEDILESYSEAEFFTKLNAIPEKIKVVTYVAAEGDISTDLLSPGNQAHSRSDRELHGQCFISKKAQDEISQLKIAHPDKSVMLVAEKGTMGVGSSRMSGVNNVALWTGKKASPYIPYVNVAPIVAGTNGISPIFLTTVGVTGGIGIDLKNWVKKKDSDGNVILNNDGEPILEQLYSVETGTELIINTKTKKLYNKDETKELVDVSSSFTRQKVEFMKAGGSYSIVFGKKLQNFASNVLENNFPSPFAASKESKESIQTTSATSEKQSNKAQYAALKKEIAKLQKTLEEVTAHKKSNNACDNNVCLFGCCQQWWFSKGWRCPAVTQW